VSAPGGGVRQPRSRPAGGLGGRSHAATISGEARRRARSFTAYTIRIICSTSMPFESTRVAIRTSRASHSAGAAPASTRSPPLSTWTAGGVSSCSGSAPCGLRRAQRLPLRPPPPGLLARAARRELRRRERSESWPTDSTLSSRRSARSGASCTGPPAAWVLSCTSRLPSGPSFLRCRVARPLGRRRRRRRRRRSVQHATTSAISTTRRAGRWSRAAGPSPRLAASGGSAVRRCFRSTPC